MYGLTRASTTLIAAGVAGLLSLDRDEDQPSLHRRVLGRLRADRRCGAS